MTTKTTVAAAAFHGILGGGMALMLAAWPGIEARATEPPDAIASLLDEPLSADALSRERGARDTAERAEEDGRVRVGVVLFDELDRPHPPQPRTAGGSRTVTPGAGSFTSTLR